MKRVLRLALLVVSLGCAQHYRTADPGIDGQTMYGQMQTFLGGGDGSSASIASTNGDTQTFQALAQDPSATVYFAQPGSLGPIESIASLTDFSAFGVPGGLSNISDVQIFFVDDPTGSGRGSALMVAIQQAGNPGYTVSILTSSGDPQISRNQYSTTLSGPTGTVVLTSNDVDSGGNLNSVIQMQVSAVDSSGNATPIGQFSTLVGFTQ